MPRATLLIVIVALLSGLLAACNDGSAGDGDQRGATLCGPSVVEQLDPDGGHLIAGVTPPSYLTNPPTSGPHTPGLGVEGGIVHEPLSPIAQVTTLEDGIVIVQYRDPADAEDLEPLAGPEVVVAPNPGLPSAVIATAWVEKLTCSGVDVESVQRFIDSVAGRHQGHSTTTAIATTTTARG